MERDRVRYLPLQRWDRYEGDFHNYKRHAMGGIRYHGDRYEGVQAR